MERVCSWCGRHLDDEYPSALGESVTHGLCSDCRDFLARNTPESVEAFINRFDVPVLLVDGNARVLNANAAACSALGAAREAVKGRLAGNVMQCAHARMPGGCGKTIHCAGCQIRISITHTHRTGEALHGVHAYQDAEGLLPSQGRSLVISTEKAGDYVLLRVDAMETTTRPVI
ncbi:MAG TPA: PAS domain-containing protein [Spirochaetia bacterium]|nr:PAS domain-containing protein [Spirochaetia bacterium]